MQLYNRHLFQAILKNAGTTEYVIIHEKGAIMKSYDIILIGTGQATGTILPSMLEAGLKVAVIEKDRVGGSCVNWGCTPTKTLVANAKVASMISRSEDYGIDCPSFEVNFPEMMRSLNKTRDESEKSFREYLEKVTDFYSGSGSFKDDHTIDVEMNSGGISAIRGETIIIHTGAKAIIPSLKGIGEVTYLTNRSLFSLKELPRHLLIIGGSYIALEIGQIFRRLGSDVSILEKNDRLIAREDRDISEGIQKVLEDEGISVWLNTQIEKVEKAGEGLCVTFGQNGIKRQEGATHLLAAVGRAAQSQDLHLERTGIETTEKGYIKINEYCQTSLEHVYALGDVNGEGAFTHTSVHDGQIFLDHYFKRGSRSLSSRTATYALYTDPPVGRVGMNEQEAKKTGKDVMVCEMPMSSIARAKEKKETQGKIKIVVDRKTDEILGATIFGVGGDELIGIINVMMQSHLPYSALQNTVIPHPTVGELIPFMFSSLRPLE